MVDSTGVAEIEVWQQGHPGITNHRGTRITEENRKYCFRRLGCLLGLKNGDEELHGKDVESYLVEQAQKDITFKRLMQEKDSNLSKEQIVWEVMADLLVVANKTLSRALVKVLHDHRRDQVKYKLAHCLLNRPAVWDVGFTSTNTGRGWTALHTVITKQFDKEEDLSLVKAIVFRCPALVNVKDHSGCTPLHIAITKESEGTLIKAIVEAYGADIHVVDDKQRNVLHLAALHHNPEMVEYFCSRGVSVNAKCGYYKSTPLHVAAKSGCVESARYLLEKGADINASNSIKYTALHSAVEYRNKDVVSLLITGGAKMAMRERLKNFTPLDLAAEMEYEEILDLLCNRSSCKDINHESSLRDIGNVKRVNDGLVASEIRKVSHFGVVKMIFKSNPKKQKHSLASERQQRSENEDRHFNFFEMIDNSKTSKESTRAMLDHFVMGERIVNCEIFDMDSKGNFPEHEEFNPRSAPLLDAIVETNNTELALHPAVKAVVDHKWKTFFQRLLLLYCVFHLVRTVLFTIALLIAARPDLHNPECYRDGRDVVRGILEGLTLALFLAEIIIKVLVFACSRYKSSKIQDKADPDPKQQTCSRQSQQFWYSWPVYSAAARQILIELKELPWCAVIADNIWLLLAVVLPFTIIPFRAATTWCASTGVAYCALPVVNNTVTDINSTDINSTDINDPCTQPPRMQWIVAALAYLVNAILILQFLPLFKRTGVYVQILKKIAKSDIWKFIILYLVFLIIFVLFFCFFLRGGVTITSDGQLTSDVNWFVPNYTYPYTIIIFGVRMLMESGGVSSDHFTADDNIMYNGDQWRLVILYTILMIFMTGVLLTLLNSQISHLSTQVREDAKGTLALERARVVVRLQKQWFFTIFLLSKLGCIKKKFYKDYIWIVPEETKPWVKRKKPNSLIGRVIADPAIDFHFIFAKGSILAQILKEAFIDKLLRTIYIPETVPLPLVAVEPLRPVGPDQCRIGKTIILSKTISD